MKSDTTETSVLVSLEALAALEAERVAEDERARERQRLEAERARACAREAELAAEAARIAAERAARSARERAAVEEAARLDAIRQAELERARVEAEHEARRLAAEEARRHELELGRLASARAARRQRGALWLGLAVVLCGGSAAAVGIATNSGPSAAESARAAGARSELRDLESRYRELLRVRLARLDELAAELSAEADKLGASASDTLAAQKERVARARAAVVDAPGDPAAIDALDLEVKALQAALGKARIAAALAALDGRYARATALAAKAVRPPAALGAAALGAETARKRALESPTDERAVAAYDDALTALEQEIVRQPGAASALGTSTVAPPASHGPAQAPCHEHDPLCGYIAP